MSIIHRLVDIEGDSQRETHRVPLIENGIQLSLTNWLEITAGTDPLPVISSTTPITVIASVVPQESGIENGISRTLVHMQRDSTTSSFFNIGLQGEGIVYQISVQGGGNNYAVSAGTQNFLNKKIILVTQYNGVINNVNSVGFFPNSRKATNQLLVAPATAFTNQSQPIGRNLSDTKIRECFNLGSALAAGEITSNDICLDLNGVNGSPPVGFVAGSKQLTLKHFTDTTETPTGWTYANFNAL
jgi:hypothetical protein